MANGDSNIAQTVKRVVTILITVALAVMGFIGIYVFNEAVSASEKVKLLEKDVAANCKSVSDLKDSTNQNVDKMQDDLEHVKKDIASIDKRQSNTNTMLKLLLEKERIHVNLEEPEDSN